MLEDTLSAAIQRAAEVLIDCQRSDGHWSFELEAGVFVPAKYILLRHFLGEPENDVLEQRIARYLRTQCRAGGGWAVYEGGPFDLSASVKAYYALKLCGDAVDAPWMKTARAAILAHGGAQASDVFTRLQLALFEQIPWRAIPAMPLEIMALPSWFPFSLARMSAWSRAYTVPTMVLMALKPKARNPRRVDIRELFITAPEAVEDWYDYRRQGFWPSAFRAIDRLLHRLEPHFPQGLRQRCLKAAVEWTRERLNGHDGLGAIFPPMASVVMLYDTLGYGPEHPERKMARDAIERLLISRDGLTHCQPCVSPVWDSALASMALLETGEAGWPAARAGLDWLRARQINDVVGDWAVVRPGLAPGGWAFQYGNAHYPDVDDTAVVAMAMDRYERDAGTADLRPAIERAQTWVTGMQSRNGGWGAFDADNTAEALNAIPFADHGCLLDPPTADVSARCLSMLRQLGQPLGQAAVRSAIRYLLAEQEDDGSWFGRWGTNYLYGTWSALCALRAADLPAEHPAVVRAIAWLRSRQRPEGGWGEDNLSYWPDQPHGQAGRATASQTAWALLGLMTYVPADDPALARGVAYLLATRNGQGTWDEPEYTACGFPQMFYLRYHGYPLYFPLWALARYRNHLDGELSGQWGM